MLGHDVAAALPELRAHAESLLVDAGVLQRITGHTIRADGWREDVWATHWSGPIRLRTLVVGSDRDAAGQPVAVTRVQCSLPVSVTGVRVGDRIVPTSSDVLAGDPLYVTEVPPLGTHAVLRRLTVSTSQPQPTR